MLLSSEEIHLEAKNKHTAADDLPVAYAMAKGSNFGVSSGFSPTSRGGGGYYNSNRGRTFSRGNCGGRSSFRGGFRGNFHDSRDNFRTANNFRPGFRQPSQYFSSQNSSGVVCQICNKYN